MSANPPQARRPRRGSLERPLSGRIYRGTWLLVGLPLLLAAFSVIRASPLPKPDPDLPPAFDRTIASGLAAELVRRYPAREPGTRGDFLAADWLVEQLATYKPRIQRDRFTAKIPGRGEVVLENVAAIVPGRLADAIVIMAHRDNTGAGPGANDNASGTAALVELAHVLTLTQGGIGPSHTFIYLSTDAGTAGGLGADRFARTYNGPIAAVVNLDGIAGPGRPRIVISGDRPRSPPLTLVVTAAARIREQTGRGPARTRALGQLVDLGFPLSLYEQAPFVGRGIPAITITTLGERPPSIAADTVDRMDRRRFGQLGRAAESLVGSIDHGPDLSSSSSSYIYLGARAVRGWAVELVLIAMLLPFVFATVDLFARCRRRRIPLAPALRSYRSRLLLWLWVAGWFELFALLGVWPIGAARPLDPTGAAAGDWHILGLATIGLLTALGWAVVRQRLVPRGPLTDEEELAGQTAGLLALGGVALLVIATNPFALFFVLLSLHAWLWLPQVRTRPPWLRALVLAAGYAGPFVLLASVGLRLGLGLDAPWYVAELTAVRYVPFLAVLVAAAWLAAAHLLTALALGRYAPYPARDERPPRGPIRSSVRALVLASRGRRGLTQSEKPPIQSEA